MKNNLFWLLFGSTALGLSLCGLALYFLILFAMAQDQVLDFAEDIHTVREEIKDHCDIDQNQRQLADCISRYSTLYGFIFQLVDVEPKAASNNSENDGLTHAETHAVTIVGDEIGTVGDSRIYEYEGAYGQEGFQAIMPLHLKAQRNAEPRQYWLVAQDDLELLYEESLNSVDEENQQDGLDIALMGAIYGIFILLIILALFLYFPVRKLNRWIGDVQHASDQIAKQNYEVRLSEYKTQPLGHLASSFNGMAEKIQDHIRDKNVLANAIAHELRTPLTRFRLALGLLNRQPIEGLAKELVNDLERYTDELEKITDNTLRLATLRDSKINFQLIKLDEFIVNEGNKFSASFPHLTVQVSSQPCELKTDMGFLQLALDNLLSNACQYAESNISLHQWQEGNRITIEISDDGPGIPEKDVEYVQQAFTRLDESRARATGGTGLGLAIVRLAVQRLQGQLEFLPAVSIGTKIRLILIRES